ncbi:hypothetical protein AAHA92_28974 [Salvia divinorum]|uniref:Secreted protein n=1 Tax=Salvia divinorum TaxID=28513 RepID=A0ABD1FWS5_SALDI
MESLTLFLLICVTFSVSRARPLGPTAASDADTSSELASNAFSSVPAASPWLEDISIEDVGLESAAMDAMEAQVKGSSANNDMKEAAKYVSEELDGPTPSMEYEVKGKATAKGPSASAAKKKTAAMAEKHKGSSEN